MRRSIYLLALAPLALVGCGSEPATVTTTTTTQEVTTTGPAREVVVARTPPAVRVEAQTVAPGTGYSWTRGYWRWTGSDYVLGGKPLGASPRRLGVDRGSLAVVVNRVNTNDGRLLPRSF